MRYFRKKNDFNLLKFLRLIGHPFFYVLVAITLFLTALTEVLQKAPLYLIKLFSAIKNALQNLTSARYSLPQISLPSLKIPSVSLPQITLPKLSPPQIPTTLPELKLPRPSLPQIKLHLPSLPTIKKPSTSFSWAPKIKTPSFRLIIQAILITSISTWFYTNVIKDLPHPKELTYRTPPLTTKIFDKNQQLLYKVYKDENRSLIQLEELPPHVVQATLAIEDANFYHHTGFSIKGIIGAINRNLTNNTLHGGSTITQQLVKNALLTNEKTLRRKIRELVLAVGTELYYTKDQILEMYLNEVAYGGTAYGIEEAAQQYFAISAKDLSLPQAALLAGLPASPTTYSPFGARSQLAVVRQHEVLRRMSEEGYISQEEALIAQNTPLTYAPPETNITAPHFVMYVKDQLVNQLGENVVNQGGLQVTTTLDFNLHQYAQTVIDQELEKLAQLHVTNAAVLILDAKTGDILTMIGSRDYFDTDHDGQVNVALRPRQPGSSIKPLTYALALENGFTPSSIIKDTPVVYSIAGSPPYAPKNYDNRFHGTITLREALANSYNVPAVKILSQLGVNNLVEKARQFGISTWNNPSRFGLALTLGGGEVTLLDMGTAYAAFANQGLRPYPQSIHTIINASGQQTRAVCQKVESSSITVQALEDTCAPIRATNPVVAYQISDILSDNRARSRAFGFNSVLNIKDHQVAVKTGTTNDLRDNWTIGYTSDYVVAVWVGNNDNSSMSHVVSGITGASPIWNKIMTHLLKDQPAHAFTPPKNMIAQTICPLTNTLSCAACPNPREEFFLPGTQPKFSCTSEQIHAILNPNEDAADPERDKILTGISAPALSP